MSKHVGVDKITCWSDCSAFSKALRISLTLTHLRPFDGTELTPVAILPVVLRRKIISIDVHICAVFEALEKSPSEAYHYSRYSKKTQLSGEKTILKIGPETQKLQPLYKNRKFNPEVRQKSDFYLSNLATSEVGVLPPKSSSISLELQPGKGDFGVLQSWRSTWLLPLEVEADMPIFLLSWSPKCPISNIFNSGTRYMQSYCAEVLSTVVENPKAHK